MESAPVTARRRTPLFTSSVVSRCKSGAKTKKPVFEEDEDQECAAFLSLKTEMWANCARIRFILLLLQHFHVLNANLIACWTVFLPAIELFASPHCLCLSCKDPPDFLKLRPSGLPAGKSVLPFTVDLQQATGGCRLSWRQSIGWPARLVSPSHSCSSPGCRLTGCVQCWHNRRAPQKKINANSYFASRVSPLKGSAHINIEFTIWAAACQTTSDLACSLRTFILYYCFSLSVFSFYIHNLSFLF